MCYQSNLAVCTRTDSRIGSLCKDLLTEMAATTSLDAVEIMVDSDVRTINTEIGAMI